MARIALASCSEFPAGDEDADLLTEAFERAGHQASWQVWDDPAVVWSTFDLTVVRATWDYTSRRAEFLAWAGGLPLVLNPFPMLSWSSDKVYLRDLAAADVPTVPTTFVAPGEPLPADLVGEYVVKPSVGAGSRGAGRFVLPAEVDAARRHLAALHADTRTVLVQPYVAGVDTAGETAVVCLGGTVSHAAGKAALLPPGTVRGLATTAAADDHGLFVHETMTAARPTPAETAVAEQVLAYATERFGVTPAYARVDLLPGPGGPLVVEAELVEPSLFLDYAPDPAAAADRLVAAVAAVLAHVTLPDPARLAALRRMKLFAGALLLIAAAVFVVARVVGGDPADPPVWGYLATMAEAAMVGGLADWFAVTALFRHPLGIPIPHTAIIPRKKDQIGDSLATFVQENFLTADVVGGRLATLELSRRVGEFLADPDHARRVVDEAAVTLEGVSRVLRDDAIAPALARLVEERLRALDVAPVSSRVLDAVVDSGQHQVALTGILRGLGGFLDENRAVFRQRLAQESPEWVPSWVDDRVFDRLFRGVQTFVSDVVNGPDHPLRQRFDTYLRDYAVRLRDDPATIEKLDAAKNQLLDHEAVRAWLETLWDHVKVAVLGSAADPDSQLRRSATSIVVSAGRALTEDAALRARVEAVVQRGVAHVVTRYGVEAGALISSTVARWDAQETGRRLELQVGRDLQFIRINGTVVGALVGLVIHAVGQLL